MATRKNVEATGGLRRPMPPAMRWHDISPGRGVLEIDGSPFSPTVEVGKPEVGIELAVWWGGGARTRALWLLSESGRALRWAAVGEA